MTSNEMFYRDAQGQKRDAKLHAAMLGDDRSTPADERRLIRLAMSFGLSRADAKRASG